MKRILLLFLPFLAASCGQVKQQAPALEPINVMSFNIRYDNPEDSLDNWKFRKDRAANAIRFYNVDILGTQEVLHNQLEDLKQRLPEYDVIGVGREDGKEKGEYSALWYKKDRFTLIDSGYFWLSETPEVAGSKGWDGACERIASWAKLKDKVTGKEVFAFDCQGTKYLSVAPHENSMRSIYPTVSCYLLFRQPDKQVIYIIPQNPSSVCNRITFSALYRAFSPV